MISDNILDTKDVHSGFMTRENSLSLTTRLLNSVCQHTTEASLILAPYYFFLLIPDNYINLFWEGIFRYMSRQVMQKENLILSRHTSPSPRSINFKMLTEQNLTKISFIQTLHRLYIKTSSRI